MNRIIPTFILTIFLCNCSHLTNNTSNSYRSADLSKDTNFTITDNDKKKSSEDCETSIHRINFPTSKEATDNADNNFFVHTPESESVNFSLEATFDQALDFCQASQDFWQKGEPENAIQSLDQAYSLIINTEYTDEPKLLQQKEDLRFMISKRILEIYASRNTVANGNYNAIPLIMNREVQSEIKRFTTNEKTFFKESLKRSGRYRPAIQKALKEAGLPEELSWLPLVESGFKIRALSRARALGLWQFIPSTGYKFGLKRNEFIDERLDPEKATTAAIAYLTELHKIFGDWTTVLAAYNCGEGRVLKIIRNQNVNYLDNFWDLYGRLPRETARYVPRFLATLHIINNPEKYGFSLSGLDAPIECENVTITKQVHLKSIAELINIPLKTLCDLNPALRYKILPDSQYTIRVPSTKGDTLLASLDNLKVTQLPQRSFSYHRVRRGESLSTIANRYRTSIRAIARANNINKRNLIVAGKILKIPHRGSSIHRSYASSSKTYNVNASEHIVKRGDSLWIIARRYRTTTKSIQKLNNLKTTDLHIGQVIKLPGYKNKTEKKVTASAAGIYHVKRGDSPFSIAAAHNMNLSRLLSLNNLTSKSTIYPGQQLYIE